MLQIETVVVTPFQQNCRLIWCDETREACLVDPGGEGPRLLEVLGSRKVSLGKIWLTHSHLDHSGGVRAVKAGTGAMLYGHRSEEFFRKSVPEACRMFGLESPDMEECPEPDVYLEGGEVLRVGTAEFTVLGAPGHSSGGLCFYCRAAKTILVGDVLFAGSIGRTDLPGGDMGALMRSIKALMNELPGDTRVLAGHGPDTTLERERATNPFLGGLK